VVCLSHCHENDIKVHKTAVTNLVTFAHENYQCPVLDDDQAFVHPCDNMDYEDIDKAIENGKVPSTKSIVVWSATVTPKQTVDYILEKQVPLAMQLNLADSNVSQVDVVVGPIKCYDPLTEEGHNFPLPLPKPFVSDMVPNKNASLPKRKYVKYVTRTPSMDNDSSKDDSPIIVTRSKGKVASCAKSICLSTESCKKNEE